MIALDFYNVWGYKLSGPGDVEDSLQTTFEQSAPLEPLPSGKRSYVPSVLDRAGERAALANTRAGVWERTTPILHYLGPVDSVDDLSSTRFTGWSKRMAEAVGEHPFYLDISRLSPKVKVKTGKGIVPVLDRLYEAMRKRDAKFMPVAPIGENFGVCVNSVANCAIADGHGLAVRYRFRELAFGPGESHKSRLTDALEKLGLAVADSDLLIDMTYIDPDDEFDVKLLAAELEKMIGVAEWRTVTLLGTSIPAAMSEIKEGTVGTIKRHEWELWGDLNKVGLSRPLAFGDYGIQHPKPPSGGGPSMRRAIRYTTETETVVARAFGPMTDSTDDQYRELCVELSGRADYSGADYSWGDETISSCAKGQLPPGSQEMWRGAGAAHHLQLISDQLEAV